MYKVFSGVLKKVPTDEMFEKSLKNELDLQEVDFKDTIRVSTGENQLEYLLFRLSFQESTREGQGKYVLNEETQEFEKVYRMTPVIAAYSKEMRIICELEEYHPVKVVVFEKQKNGKKQYDLICIQDQMVGLK